MRGLTKLEALRIKLRTCRRANKILRNELKRKFFPSRADITEMENKVEHKTK